MVQNSDNKHQVIKGQVLFPLYPLLRLHIANKCWSVNLTFTKNIFRVP